MENQDGVTKVTPDTTNSEEVKEKNEASPSSESQQQWRSSGELAEDFMRRYNVPNPKHSPKAVKYLVEMYKYYEGLS